MELLLSIIVTTHSRPLLLERALRSVHFERSSDVQLLVCTDEGDSETKRVCAKYLAPHDVLMALPFLRGPAQTRNAAMAHAAGKFLCFLDDDDSFEPGYLHTIRSAVSTGFDGLLFFNYRQIREMRLSLDFSERPRYVEPSGRFEERCARTLATADRPLGSARLASLLVQNFIPNNAIVVGADIARRVQFDPYLPSHEDWDFLIALSTLVPFRHVEAYGPRVHLDAEGMTGRNMAPLKDGSLPLDYLSVYRKWRAPDASTRQARSAVLQRMGLSVSAQLL